VTYIRPARCPYIFPDGRRCLYTVVTCRGHVPCVRLRKGRSISAATAYDRYGCRCEKCREHKAVQNAKRSNIRSHFCPNCSLSFVTHEEYKAHWQATHRKRLEAINVARTARRTTVR
jgi:hypothetical protein